MKSFFLTWSIFLLLSTTLSKAQAYAFQSTRALGLSGATAALSGEWAPYHNPACMATISKKSVSLNYKTFFGLSDIHHASFYYVAPFKSVGYALGFKAFGNQLYSLNQYSIALAHEIDRVKLGFQAHYTQESIEELGTKRSISIDFGGVVEVWKEKAFLGATVKNINQAKRGEIMVPVLMNLGLSYCPSKKTNLNIEIEKDLLFPLKVKSGLEYSIIEKFSLRTGVTLHPFVNTFGCGFQHKAIVIDYALYRHSALGYSHALGLVLFFNKSK